MTIEPSSNQKLLTELLRSNKRLTRRVNVLFSCSILATAVFASAFYMIGRRNVRVGNDGVVHLSALAIVDTSGKTRVRLQAPLPEPVIMGTQQKRDDTVSGVMLYDKSGNERGGYVTDNSEGNAFLTLDSNIGQEVTLVAYPGGGAEFGINDDRKDKVVMSALGTGPRFRLVKGGMTVFEQPVPDGPKR